MIYKSPYNLFSPQQDPRFTPDEEQDPRFTADPVPPPSNTDYFLNSMKKGLIEGLPEFNMLPPEQYPGATRPDLLGDVSRASMYPVGAGAELYNKVVRPLTSPANLGMMGMAIAQPAMIPHIAAIFGAQQAMQIPGQVKDVYESAQNKGIFDPETIGKTGELGLNAAMMTAGTVGAARYPINKLVSKAVANKTDFLTEPGFEDLPNYARGATEGARMPHVERGLAVRPPIQPGVAEAVAGKAKENISGFEDILGPGGFDATLTHPDGIHAAFNEGKLTRDQALKLLQKYYKEEITPTATTSEPNVITEPMPLTTEAPSVKQPPGIQETIDLMKSGQIKNVTDLQKKTGLSYNRTKVIWYAAKKQIQDAEMKPGFFDHMKPEEPVTPTAIEPSIEPPNIDTGGLTHIIKRNASDKGEVRRLRENGYEFVGLTDQGDFRFKKPTVPINDRMETHRENTLYTDPNNKFEVLDPESELDMFGIPKNRDYTPEEVAEITKRLDEGLMNSYGEDTVEGQKALDEINGIVDSGHVSADNKAFMAAVDRGEQPSQVSWERGKTKSQTGVGKVFSNGTVTLQDTGGRNPFYTSHDESGPFESGKFRYRNGEVLWNQNPSPKDMFAVENYLEDNGMPVKSHTQWDGSPISRQPDLLQEDRTSTGGVKMGVDQTRLGDIVGNSLYGGEASNVIPRELMQNAMDAIGPGGNNRGKTGGINIKFDQQDNYVEFTDNGIGLTREQMETVLTNLAATGKGGNAANAGGFGIAKAAIFLGGEHAQVVSIARNPKTGKVTETSFEATPAQMRTGTDPLIETNVDPKTPTGTTIRVKLIEPNWGHIKNKLEKIANYSDHEGQVFLDYGFGSGLKPLSVARDTYSPLSKFTTSEASVTLRQAPESKVEISNINLVLRNNGMFQGVETMYLKRPMANIPENIMVDVQSLVEEGHKDYPWTLNRDGLRDNIFRLVQKEVNDKIVNKANEDYKDRLQELYDGLQVVTTKRRGNDVYFHDTGSKYTQDEFRALTNNPVIHTLAEIIQSGIDKAVASTGNQVWIDRVERTGLIFDGNYKTSLYGVHIPNPTTKKSTILINPLQIMSDYPPDEAAAAVMQTVVHEAAHVDYSDYGHDTTFAQRLGRIYGKLGAGRAISFQVEIRKFFTKGGPTYTPELQELLRGYQESRGRAITKEDLLTRTGSGSRINKGGQGNIPGNSGPNGKGTIGGYPEGSVIVVKSSDATPANIKKLYDEGYRFEGANDQGNLRFKKSASASKGPILEEEVGSVRPTKQAIKKARLGQLGAIQDAQKSSAILEAFNFPRGVMAAGDLSAPLRQGLPFIHKKEFWNAMKPMFDSWATEEGFEASQNNIANKPLFKKRIDLDGEVLPSFADDAGLKLTDLTSLSSREEQIMSTWAESGGMFNKNETMAKYGGNQLASAYAGTYGNIVRRSNRSYTAFINNLRADLFESMIQDGNILADVKNNLPQARAIADFVNTFTGRGSLGKLEPSATILNTFFFAPRLMASRIKMLNVLNPNHYIYGNKQIRIEALKSLFAITAFGNVVLQLIKMSGGEVESDPASSDFGKGKVGDTRVDPWGGMQQYIVAANRLIRPSWAKIPIKGKEIDTGIVPVNLSIGYARAGGWRSKSSTTGKESDLMNPKGPYGQTPADIAGRFIRGKTNPVINFAWALATGAKEMSGKPMNMTTMNPMENAIMQRFIPILWQDVYEISKTNPVLLPLMIPAAFGMGIQNYGDNK